MHSTCIKHITLIVITYHFASNLLQLVLNVYLIAEAGGGLHAEKRLIPEESK